ncbi:AAA family ATPase [Chrysiogenes arsenatis]|uniref:AAA family ATPase n=1 Tax=Chrysiogenes arsenatis TaxID=309797 RepID=UPI0004132135|nr:AAA family ATPase [Chrysiogenes arsenatis]
MILAFCGLSGSGKSYLAAHIAAHTGLPHLRSDVIRKELAGIAPDASSRSTLGSGIYTNDLTQETYTTLIARACALPNAIIDATFSRRAWREQLYRSGIPYLLIHCWAPEAVCLTRITARLAQGNDPSEATPAVYFAQRLTWEGFTDDESFFAVDTTQPQSQLTQSILLHSTDSWDSLFHSLKKFFP